MAPLWQSTDKGCQVFRLIKTSASLRSLITPHKDPWVASMSTLRLKWMFTSPNDYLSHCWVNVAASVLSTTRLACTLSHTDETSAWGLCTSCLPTKDHLQSCYYFGVCNDFWAAWWLAVASQCKRTTYPLHGVWVFIPCSCRFPTLQKHPS